MAKFRDDETGFSVVEVLLVVLVLAVIGFGGYFVWHTQQTSKVTPASSKTATTTNSPIKTTPGVDSYAGWNSYTLKYEKATFKYPPSFTLKDSSTADAKTVGGGIDLVKLTGSNGFEISIFDGGPNDYGFPLGGLNSINADPVTFLGAQAYLNSAEVKSTHTGSVYTINLTTTTTGLTDFPADKNVTAPSYGTGTQNKFLITMDYNANVDFSGGQPVYPNEPLATVLKDKNYQDAKLVISSFTY